MSIYLETVNKTKINAKILKEILQLYESMKPEERSNFEIRSLACLRALELKGFGIQKASALSVAIELRLDALSRLINDPVHREWVMPSKEADAVMIHFDLLRVAATEPLIEIGGARVAFDPEAFRVRFLRICRPKGRA
ncbi:hypothetical protein [Rhodocista pekingensis]|uniref:Uncharacterized protein n=1 Tax=Rhodocista pekingensis TaxID=201185 RepID=A0ABW2KVJ2_9PROT